MAGDYIRREDARRIVVQLDKYAWKSPVSDERRVTVDVDLVKFGLDRIPAADVAEVVRCKDCEYLVNTTINANGFLICDISDMEIAPDDFCSYGERREE